MICRRIRLLGPGAALTFLSNSNTGSNQETISQAVASGLGPPVAMGSKRIVGRCVLKAAAPVLNDEFIIRFLGAAEPSGSIAATTAAAIVRHMEPAPIAPGKMLILQAWWPSGATGPNIEPYLTVIER